MKVFGTIGRIAKKVVGHIIPALKKVGSFVANNHQHIAPLAHNLALASGNATAADFTGAALKASQLASGVEGLVGDRITAMRAQHSQRPAVGVPVGGKG